MREYLLIAPILLILLSVPLLSGDDAEEDYNVIFITVEAVNADHVGFHGYERNTTPNIDNLAEESIVFTNATTPSASTIYSVPAKFTSLYPHMDKVVADNPREADPAWQNDLSLTRKFQDEGYYTKGIVAHEWVKSRWGFDKFFDDFDDDFKQGTYNESPVNQSLSEFEIIKHYWKERDAEETTNLAEDFLSETDEKFFLWLHYFDPHSPYMPPEKEYLEMFQNPYTGENETEEYYIYGDDRNISDHRIHQLRNRYDGELRYTDTQIGKLLDTLEEQNLSENTVIVLTSDHGECTGENNVFDHNRLHWCSLHVPLIIHIPGEEPERIEKPVSTIDILPTLLDLLDIDYERFVRGNNILSEDYREYHYAERSSDHILFNYGPGDPLKTLEETSREPEKLKENRTLPSEVEDRLAELGYTE